MKDKNVFIFDEAQNVSEEELCEDFKYIPEWRKEKALSYRFLIDRVLCVKAYLMLKMGLKKIYGIDYSSQFEYIGHGKPVLRDYPDIHFNLSHCKKAVMCVIDSRPVGCDIEEIRDVLDMKLCKYCFNDTEVERIISSEKPCVEFVKLWTMKEAVLKLTGEGISKKISDLLTDELLAKIDFYTMVCEEKGYVYTVCQFKSPD